MHQERIFATIKILSGRKMFLQAEKDFAASKNLTLQGIHYFQPSRK